MPGSSPSFLPLSKTPSYALLETCFTKFPVISVTFVIVTATQTNLILPGRLPLPYLRPYAVSTLLTSILLRTANHDFPSWIHFLGHRPIHFSNSLTVHLVLYVFPQRFTFYKKSSRTPLLSWHFLFLTSVNDDEDDDNSNNTAAAGANFWELTMGVALINILFNSQTHDVYTLL